MKRSWPGRKVSSTLANGKGVSSGSCKAQKIALNFLEAVGLKFESKAWALRIAPAIDSQETWPGRV